MLLSLLPSSRTMPGIPDRLIVYSRPGCTDCTIAHDVLKKFEVVFDEINILDNPVAQQAMMAANGGVESVPTIVFKNGTVLVEPTAEAFEQALRDRGLIF